MSGYYGSLSDEQFAALQELRAKLGSLPPRYNDLFLLRFLRARKCASAVSANARQ